MDYRQTIGQYQETSRNRNCISYSINPDEAYNRNMAYLPRESRSPENWRKRNEPNVKPQNNQSDPRTMDFNHLVQGLNPDFIAEHLQRTYNFLKGPDSEILFSNLTPFEEEFLLRLVDLKNLEFPFIHRNLRTLARDVIDVVEQSKGEFEWIHVFRKDQYQRILKYQKLFLSRRVSNRDVFKMPQCPIQERLLRNSMELSTIDTELARARGSYSEPSDATSVSDDQDSKGDLTRKQRQFKQLCESVGEPFIVSSIQQLIDFIEDDTRDTMEFKDLTSDKARFLKSLKTLKKKRQSSVLSTSTYKLFGKYSTSKKMQPLNIREGKANGRHRLRDVTVKKLEKSKPKRKNSNSKNKDIDEKIKQITSYNPMQLFKSINNATSDQDTRRIKTQNQNNDSSNKSTKTEPSDRLYNAKGINWCREGRPGSPESSSGQLDRGRPARRSKLMEALCQPIELGVAKGMMEKMGWKGGALGVRGEGITEPIMPALDLKAGAGLGHTQSHTPNQNRRKQDRPIFYQTTVSISPQSPEFKLGVLDEILTLLRGKMLRVEVKLDPPANDRERLFFFEAADAFNKREPLPCKTEREKDVSCRILANMNCNMKLELIVDISRDSRVATIKKTKTTKSRGGRGRRRKKTEDDKSDCQDADVRSNDIDRLADKLREKHPNEVKRTLIALAFRITFLEKIFKFVDNYDLESAEVTFQVMLTKKQRKFLENIVINVNKREKAGYSTSKENVTYGRIVYGMDGFKLKITFPSARSFNLEKIYRHKRDEPRERKRSKERNRDISPETRHRRDRRSRDRERSLSPYQKNGKSITPEERKKRNETIRDKRHRKDSSNESKGRSESPKERKPKIRSVTPDVECLTPELESYTPEPQSLTPEMRSLTPELKKEKDTVLISDDESINLDNYDDDDDESDYDDVKIVDDDKAICVIESTVSMNQKIVDADISKEEEDCIVEVFEGSTNVSVVSDNDEDVLVIDTTETIGSEPNSAGEIKSNKDTKFVKINETNCEGTDTFDVENYKEKKCKIIEVKSEDSPDLSPASSKRSRSSSESSITQAKRVKISEDSKMVLIKCDEGLPKDWVKDAQKVIAKSIDSSDFLPLLKCKGIQHDSLVYVTDNNLSTEWLKNVLKEQESTFKLEIKEYEPEVERINVSFKIYDFTEEETIDLFKRIKRYNPMVNIDSWKVINAEKKDDFLVNNVDIDEVSYKVICEGNFTLYAGIDKVEFTRGWS